MIQLERNIKERIYQGFLLVARRLSDSQTLAILAVIVGLLAGVGAYIFNTLLHFITSSLTSWTPSDQAQWLFLIYPSIGIILATLFVRTCTLCYVAPWLTHRWTQLLDIYRGWCYDHRLWWLGRS